MRPHRIGLLYDVGRGEGSIYLIRGAIVEPKCEIYAGGSHLFAIERAGGHRYSSIAKRLALATGLFMALSLGSPDLSAILGKSAATPFQFTSTADARAGGRGGAGRGGAGHHHHHHHHHHHRPGHGAGGVGRPGHGAGGVGRPGYGAGGVGRPGYGVVRPIPAARPWYWGRAVAGVTVGAVIVTSTVPPPPSSEMCWYWTDAGMTRGYWNYCVAPTH